MSEPNYSIEARSLGVVGIASHNFWVLRDEGGKALAELHGLATERATNTPKPIGTDEDRFSLRLWELLVDQQFARQRDSSASRFTYLAEDQQRVTVLTAGRDEVLSRWNAASAAIADLNALDLDYPNYGFKLFGDTVNSNSAYRTMGEIMGVGVQQFPGVAEPGINNRMTSPEQIEGLRTHGYPVLDVPSIKEGNLYKAVPATSVPLDPADTCQCPAHFGTATRPRCA